MACGCAQNGGCGCGPVMMARRGLGFLSWNPESGGGDYFDEWEYYLTGGYCDGFGRCETGGGGGGNDVWAWWDQYWQGYDPNDPNIIRNQTFAPLPTTLPSPAPQDWWQPLIDFFRGYRPPGLDYQPTFDAGLPPPPPLCPPGYYYPDLDKGSYRCAPIGDDPTTQRKAQQQRAAIQRAQQAAKKTTQQLCQPPKVFDLTKFACVCPPRTVVDPRTGQCVRVCPPGYVPDPNTRQCVLASMVNRNIPPGKDQDWSWLLYVVGIVVVVRLLTRKRGGGKK